MEEVRGKEALDVKEKRGREKERHEDPELLSLHESSMYFNNVFLGHKINMEKMVPKSLSGEKGK